jgi:hypothetical protein
MQAATALPQPIPFVESGAAYPARPCAAEAAEDTRFRRLLPLAAWAGLPASVRARFSKRISAGATVVYKGHVTNVRYSAAGWLLAQVLRIAGARLPLSRAEGLESVVTVTEDRHSGGQFWTRMFARERGFPQMIHSVKRFAGPTGLEEALPFGIVMALRLSVVQQTLCFTSAGYTIRVGRWHLPLPRALTPGDLTVTHTGLDAHAFRFTLTLTHAVLGTLLHQEAVYAEDVL